MGGSVLNQRKRGLIVAIDGPAGAGKSTVARQVAKRLGYLYIDSGAMYRAITVELLHLGIDPHHAKQVVELAHHMRVDLIPEALPPGNRVYVNGIDVTDNVRQPAVNEAVPVIAQYPEIRTILKQEQQRLAKNGAVVMDGRDIGTAVLPDADVKVFLTASLEERAMRRYREMVAQGFHMDVDQVACEVAARDETDRNRLVSPLVQAADACVLDTTGMNIDMVVEHVLALCWQHL